MHTLQIMYIACWLCHTVITCWNIVDVFSKLLLIQQVLYSALKMSFIVNSLYFRFGSKAQKLKFTFMFSNSRKKGNKWVV